MKLPLNVIGKLSISEMLDKIERHHCYSDKIDEFDLGVLMQDTEESEEKYTAHLTLLVRNLKDKLNISSIYARTI